MGRRSVRADGVVLRPVHDEAEAAWVAAISTWLGGEGFRVARPVPATHGWTCDGWAAWRLVDGESSSASRWDDVLTASRPYHRALADLTRPSFLDHRATEADVVDPTLAPLVEPLLERLEDVDLPSQIVHGDLPGNVLFARGQPPAVVDLAPCWRPVGFADAVVVVDAIVRGGADWSLLGRVDHQLLLRAALRRILGAPAQAAASAELVARLTGGSGRVRPPLRWTSAPRTPP